MRLLIAFVFLAQFSYAFGFCNNDDIFGKDPYKYSSRQKGIHIHNYGLWHEESTVRIYFLDGSNWQRKKVKSTIPRIFREISLNWVEVNDLQQSDVRITFQKTGNYSRVGKPVFEPKPYPRKETMSLGDVRSSNDKQRVERVILHEFGHALGLQHEHQHPAFPYHFIKKKTQDWCNKTLALRGDKCKLFVMNKFGFNNPHTQYDKYSIMHYYFPSVLFEGNVTIPENLKLSQADKDLLNTIYPTLHTESRALNSAVSTRNWEFLKKANQYISKTDLVHHALKTNNLQYLQKTFELPGSRPKLKKLKENIEQCAGYYLLKELQTKGYNLNKLDLNQLAKSKVLNFLDEERRIQKCGEEKDYSARKKQSAIDMTRFMTMLLDNGVDFSMLNIDGSNILYKLYSSPAIFKVRYEYREFFQNLFRKLKAKGYNFNQLDRNGYNFFDNVMLGETGVNRYDYRVISRSGKERLQYDGNMKDKGDAAIDSDLRLNTLLDYLRNDFGLTPSGNLSEQWMTKLYDIGVIYLSSPDYFIVLVEQQGFRPKLSYDVQMKFLKNTYRIIMSYADEFHGDVVDLMKKHFQVKPVEPTVIDINPDDQKPDVLFNLAKKRRAKIQEIEKVFEKATFLNKIYRYKNDDGREVTGSLYHVAIEVNNSTMIHSLIAYDVDHTLKNSDGQDAYAYAQSLGRPRIASILKRKLGL